MPARIYVSTRSEAYVVIIHAWVHAVTFDEIYVILRTRIYIAVCIEIYVAIYYRGVCHNPRRNLC